MDIFEQLVLMERTNQDLKWGEQNHSPEIWLCVLIEEVGELANAIQEYRFGAGEKENMGDELVQIAAVARVFFESGRRNGWL